MIREHLAYVISRTQWQVAISLQNGRMVEALEEQATTDGLTGLVNHRTFQERLSVTEISGSGAWEREGWSEGDSQTWMEWRPARMNPRPWTRKRADNQCSMGRPQPSGGQA